MSSVDPLYMRWSREGEPEAHCGNVARIIPEGSIGGGWSRVKVLCGEVEWV